MVQSFILWNMLDSEWVIDVLDLLQCMLYKGHIVPYIYWIACTDKVNFEPILPLAVTLYCLSFISVLN